MVLSTYLHYNPPKTFCSRYYYYSHFSEEVAARESEPLLKITQPEIDELGFMLRLPDAKGHACLHCMTLLS